MNSKILTLSKTPLLKRIEFIEENNDLCHKGLLQRTENYTEYSNCYGTAAYILGAEEYFIQGFPTKENQGMMVIGDIGEADASFIPIGFTRPGYISGIHFNYFLKRFCKSNKDPKEGDIVLLYNNGKIIHSMIYLGNAAKNIYEQDGFRGPFKFDELERKVLGYSYQFFRFQA